MAECARLRILVSVCQLIKLSGTEGGKSPGGALPSPDTGSAVSLDTDGPDLFPDDS